MLEEEHRIAAARGRIVENLLKREIYLRDLSQETLAEKLDLLPIGVEIFFSRSWSLGTCSQVAALLDIPFEIKVGEE